MEVSKKAATENGLLWAPHLSDMALVDEKKDKHLFSHVLVKFPWQRGNHKEKQGQNEESSPKDRYKAARYLMTFQAGKLLYFH